MTLRFEGCEQLAEQAAETRKDVGPVLQKFIDQMPAMIGYVDGEQRLSLVNVAFARWVCREQDRRAHV